MSTRNEEIPATGPDIDDHLGIFVLSAFAFAQPLYDVTARDPQLFLERGTSPALLLVATLAVLLGPPALLSLGTWMAGRVSGRAGRGVAAVSSVLLLGAIVLPPVARWLSIFPAASLAVSATAALLWGAVRRRSPARQFVRLLTPALVVFPAVFLVAPGPRALLFPVDAEEVAAYGGELPHPVVLVVFDELSLTALLDSDEWIRSDLFPNFAELAEQAHWFRAATTVHNYTVRALPALLTGRYPDLDSPRLTGYEGHPLNLLSWLRNRAETGTSPTAKDFLPPSMRREASDTTGLAPLLHDFGWIWLHATIPRPWASRLPRLGDHGQAPADAGRSPVDRFLGGLETLRPGGAPRLHFFYTMLPHSPLDHLPSGRRYNDPKVVPAFSPELTGDAPWHGTEEVAAAAFHRYRLQLGATDRILGGLLDHLEENGLFDRTLLVVTSDHGVAYRFGGARRGILEHDLRAEVLPIPLFVKLPGQTRGVVHDTSAESVDVLPTIADLLDLEVPWQVDGRSLLDPSTPARSALRFVYDDLVDEIPMQLPVDPEPRREAVRRWERLLGAARPEASVFGWGPHADLVGTDLGRTPHGAPLDNVIAVREAPDPRASADGGTEPLPLHLVYRLDSPVASTLPRWWALTIGDRIGAVTPRETLPYGGQRVAGVLAEDLWDGGPFETALYALHESDGVRRLRPVSSSTPAARALAVFEGLERHLAADASSGFEGLSAGPGTQIEGRDRLQITSPTSPSIVLDLGAVSFARLGVRIALESPRPTRACLRWQVEDDPRFWWTRRRCRHVEAGSTDVSIVIESTVPIVGPVRLELDAANDAYVVDRAEVRGSVAVPEPLAATGHTGPPTLHEAR